MKAQRSKPQLKGCKNRIAEIGFGIASAINALIPCLNMISLCSVPDYTDSARSLFEAMAKSNLPHKPAIIWHVKDPKTVRTIYREHPYEACRVLFVRKNRLPSFLLFCLSRYIVDTHGLYSMVKMKNCQTSLYLTHGMPVKKFGFEYENDIKIGVQFADYALATSPFYRDVISKSMGIPLNRVFPVGIPRNDVFFTDDNEEEHVYSLFSSRFVLYLPTYRVSNSKNMNNGRDLNEGDFLFGGTWEEWEALNQTLLQRKTKMVVKPHPMEKHNDIKKLASLSQLVVIDDSWILRQGLSLNLIMKYSSALVTDYSGAFVDYLLTDKPIVFYVPDYKEYKDSRGYVVDDLMDTLPGEVVSEFLFLREALDRDARTGKRAAAREKLNTQHSASATDAVLGILFENRKRDLDE